MSAITFGAFIDRCQVVFCQPTTPPQLSDVYSLLGSIKCAFTRAEQMTAALLLVQILKRLSLSQDIAVPLEWVSSKFEFQGFQGSFMTAAASVLAGGRQHARAVMLAEVMIEQNYPNERLRLEDVAAAVGMSRARFSRLFKRETGIRFRDFLRARRVAAAKTLLGGTTLTVKEIAVAVGYRPSELDRNFRLLTGLSPMSYRCGAGTVHMASDAD